LRYLGVPRETGGGGVVKNPGRKKNAFFILKAIPALLAQNKARTGFEQYNLSP
jgi:hypothetical protein